MKKEASHRSNQFNFEEITARRRNSPSEFAVSVAGVASGKNLEPPKGRERAREKVRVGGGGGGGGMGVGGPCNDLTAVVTFLISARFNYTVDEEGARPPLALAFPFRHPFVTASSSFPHQSLAQTRPVVLTRHRLANKIWLIALERFLLRSLLLSAEGEHRKKISESFLVIENLPLLRSRCDRGISDRDEFLSRIIGFLLLTISFLYVLLLLDI